jgi:hypothetical protein
MMRSIASKSSYSLSCWITGTPCAKTSLQITGKTQIVARLMVEDLCFYCIRNAEDVATCLDGYDRTAYPDGTTVDVHPLPIEAAHHKANLPGMLELPMEVRAALEIVLKESELKDAPQFSPESALWKYSVQHCGYVQSRHAIGRVLVAA